ncbi:hypothetical protein LTR37_007300 [Vermiconidia calcicola]|uniref:Uncharacterized protein n=1 Tax=Vermiconidia calcicola TaxID=1690605 RepID=A0ACC3NDY3_9PEZI|nr:hypothetical protein LTR37_007300 [Vermiconidia calcicola]
MLPFLCLLLTASCATAQFQPGVQNRVSPAYTSLYQYPLPIPPIKEPKRTYTSPNGSVIDYYEIDIKPVQQQVFPNLGQTRLVGYDGMSPGPTFVVQKGREAVVRVLNHGDRASAVHLHGAYSRAPFDGWAEDLIQTGQYKDYYYPTGQNARTLWYHDHAMDHTAENAYFGQAGFWIIHDSEELAVPGLPQGKYDIPLGLTSKRYNSDGSLWSPDANGESTSLYGDVIQVNGQPWPFLNVEPRKYRLRFLNAAISRSFQLHFENSAGTRQSFKVVGADSGLLTAPVTSTSLDLSMAERWEVVFDFAAFKGQNITLRNSRAVGVDTDYPDTDKVMRFVVGNTVTDQTKNENLPSTLRSVPFPPTKSAVDRTFNFQSDANGWNINGAHFSDGAAARVISKPPRDHQSDDGRGTVSANEKAAPKDTVWLNWGESVRVIARFAPWDGLYMFHCHNLIHEDHEMMAAMNITELSDLGYPETTRFLDPMDSKYRAKTFRQQAFTRRAGIFSSKQIDEKCAFFDSLNAYRDVDEVENALDDYWAR